MRKFGAISRVNMVTETGKIKPQATGKYTLKVSVLYLFLQKYTYT
jgi:hypothetical protein